MRHALATRFACSSLLGLATRLACFGLCALALTPFSVQARPVPPGDAVAKPIEPEPPAAAPAAQREWTDEFERDFALRSIGHLQITNLRGAVSVQGWALDKIRIKALRRARASTEAEAKAMFAAVDFRYREIDGDIELSAEYGRNLGIEERLRERKDPRTSMDFVVYAPSNLRLRVWSVAGQALVRSWRAPVEVRTQSGEIRIEDMRGEQLTLSCPQCLVSGESIQASVRCVGGSGQVSLKDVSGRQVYVETGEGFQRLENIRGQQLYLSKSGEIRGHRLSGHIEFHAQGGRVQLQETEGFVSGRTESGGISIGMLKWRFADRALLETVRGDIILSLPSSFAGEVDLWSVHSRTLLAFPLTPLDETRVYGPEPASHLRGRINGGSEQLRVFSQYGEIQVLKGL
jgi:hypothetical protein